MHPVVNGRCNYKHADVRCLSSFSSTWITHFAKTVTAESYIRDIISSFWLGALKEIYDDTLRSESLAMHSIEECVDSETRIINVPKSVFVKTYKQRVFSLLELHRNHNDDANRLELLQREIEDLTLNFSEDCIYKACPNIMEMLTKTNLPSAKEFLRGKYLMDKHYPGRMTIYAQSRSGDSLEPCASELSAAELQKLKNVLSDSDKLLLVEFGEHTIECLLVHTLGYLFNLENIVSLASLIDHIESNVRKHASFLCYKRKKLKEEADVGSKAYPFGTALVEFLVSRGLLRLVTYNTDLLNISDESVGVIPKTVVKKVVKKSKNYYRSSFVYAECLFNPALLPIKLNLPMVFPPKDWDLRYPEEDRMWLNISDIYGGYLSNPTGQIYSTQRCMSSPDPKNFFIYFGENNKPESYDKLNKFCTSISSLQRQAFKINSEFLDIIYKFRGLFEECGYLMPEFLSKVILPHASGILRSHFDKNKDIQTIYKFSDLYALLIKNMQRARYECTILDLAKAYEGYSLYFPAFLDFRGRIYRSGIFHFHERDLARSLLLLDCKDNCKDESTKKNISIKELKIIYLIATGFLYQSYKNEIEAAEDMFNKIDNNAELCKNGEAGDLLYYKIILKLVKESQKAKRPLQYLSNLILYFNSSIINKLTFPELFNSVPVTQDASASAYQLMAYFLLDNTFAKQTNLFDIGNDIFDIYSEIRIKLIDFLKDILREENPQLCAILDRVLSRSIVKKIYMPIIYGKTVNSTTKDLIECLSHDILPKECSKLAALCFQFWKNQYSYMEAFIQLISLVGRVCSTLERPVLYCAEYFSTSQDYYKMEKHSVRVFNSNSKKAHNVTLSFPSNVRDKRKSRTSTFVNFIHQKDAQIAMSMAFKADILSIPLYTVHDNFITNTYNCNNLATRYLDVIKDMGPPLKIINRFLYINLIEPAIVNGYYKNVRGLNLEYFDDKIIPDHILDEFLKIGGLPPSEVRNVAGWKKITEQLKQRYQLYCKAVCGEEKTFAEHRKRWLRFRSDLNGPNCIHY